MAAEVEAEVVEAEEDEGPADGGGARWGKGVLVNESIFSGRTRFMEGVGEVEAVVLPTPLPLPALSRLAEEGEG